MGTSRLNLRKKLINTKEEETATLLDGVKLEKTKLNSEEKEKATELFDR